MSPGFFFSWRKKLKSYISPRGFLCREYRVGNEKKKKDEKMNFSGRLKIEVPAEKMQQKQNTPFKFPLSRPSPTSLSPAFGFSGYGISVESCRKNPKKHKKKERGEEKKIPFYLFFPGLFGYSLPGPLSFIMISAESFLLLVFHVVKAMPFRRILRGVQNREYVVYRVMYVLSFFLSFY